jgi:Polyketide cyclase / dehydrase and lipid transport.
MNSNPSRKSLLWKILIGLAAVIVLFLIVVATRPSEYRVSRSAVINATPDTVFPHVNELRKWEAWNPWGKVDPNMKLTYEGPEAGVGASYLWAGDSSVGEGKATITDSKPAELVRLKLDFYKPMPGTSDAEFTFKPQGAATEVTWAMSGKNNFLGKIVCMFMNMDKMMGEQFEKGLADMKTAVEATAAASQKAE